jgi:hypothetical protein
MMNRINFTKYFSDTNLIFICCNIVAYDNYAIVLFSFS